ncbi:extracellular solute-binding protein [Iamia sp. SCSIO 61187]|uniref:extracellular solute-binding protein n=1 Tax=Iamia sp. SCSIO 61187 TaxID=2722752 RepID=UPI001C62B23E|nr:extracellular solute-binding protein [Iamia sp. SCSIO 61187]QYG91596.1 extracellular solute-binding protein [Iamia sp. SCSIO 61187]
MSRPAPRPLVHLLVVAVLAITAAACVRDESQGTSAGPGGGGGDGEGEEIALPDCPVDALDEADGPVEIDLWHGFTGEPANYMVELGRRYNESQDAVRLNVQTQGNSYEEVLRKFVAGIPSRQIPPIVMLEDTTLREVVESGVILPAEACEQADDFETGQLPVVRNYYTSEGVYWPGYTNVSEPVLYYNANQFEAAGLDPTDPPETLDELRTDAEALKESGVESPLSLILNSWFVESWITGAGETVVNKENGREGLADESTFDNPATHEVYEWIDGMADDGLLEAHSATDGQINHYLAVAQKNSAMVIETSTAAVTIKAVLGGESYDAEAGLNVGSLDPEGITPQAGPFPGLEEPGQVRVSGGAFFMTNTVPAEQQAAAWDFMKFMWSAESQTDWHLIGGYLPTTQAAAGDPDVADYWASDLAGQMLRVGYEQLLTVDPERPGPQVGPYTDYTDAIKASLEAMVLEGASPADAIAQADADIQAALDTFIEDNE